MPPTNEPAAVEVRPVTDSAGTKTLRVAGACVGLFLLTLALYWSARGFAFLNYDDGAYVRDNNVVLKGLTRDGFIWAFGYHASNWHPLTWLSHMLDVQLHGPNPGWQHLTNVLFHAANGVLVFLVFARMTKTFWRSLLVAAVFALHPMHVESVAWISERKDVLCGFFALWTLWAYAGYVGAKTLGSGTVGKRWRGGLYYGVALLCFALALLSKGMAVTLPCVLLLLDFWPLKRFPKSADAIADGVKTESVGKLVMEKIPFFLLSAAASVITMKAQSAVISAMTVVTPGHRFANAIVSYQRYLRKTLWPSDLAMVYMEPDSWPVAYIVMSLLVLVAVSVIAVFLLKRRSYLAIGWCWFLGVLFPVSGVMQVGTQAMADRFNYLPQIGLSIMVIWELNDLLKDRIRGAIVAVTALLGCVVLTHQQIQYWRDGVALWTRTVTVEPNNYFAHSYLANELSDRNELNPAIEHYRRAIELCPRYAKAHYNLALVLTRLGDRNGAADEYLAGFNAMLSWNPDDAETLSELGDFYLTQNKPEEAIAPLTKAVSLKPDAMAQRNLGAALIEIGKLDEGYPHLVEALRLNQDDAEARYYVGRYLRTKGQSEKAIVELREALRLNRDNARSMNELAWILATDSNAALRNGREALELANRACTLTRGQDPRCLDTLAAANAETGQFDSAIAIAERLCASARSVGDAKLIESMENRLALYKKHQAYRAEAPK